VVGAPAPTLAEHQESVLSSVSSAAEVLPGPARSTLKPRRPLEGLLVVECGYFFATPFAATLLAEAGARVVKLEPATGDPGRRNWKASYSKGMVGKESIVADLKSTEGREIVHALAKRADVFIHNFRPGTPERLKIDYATLQELNPRLLYVYGSCFGSQGPWSHKAGFHSSPNAIVGCGVIESGRGNPPRNRTFADPASALATAAMILVGLHARERTGRGQYLETTMLTSMAYAVSEWSLRYQGKRDRQSDAGQHGFGALQRLYATGDGWLFVECHREREWRALCDAVDPSLGEDARFASAAAREENQDALAERLAGHFAARGADAWQEELLARGVPALRASGIDHAEFMLEHPHCLENRVAVLAEQPGTPLAARAGPVIEFSEHPTPIEAAAALGSHSESILRSLGYSDEAIADLEARGITRAIGHDLPT
jgi:crotonobetainyl-CoA:carnitine CoA-transferase CaiB-like acyl-CoA transferase